jgi:hypothetical protein
MASPWARQSRSVAVIANLSAALAALYDGKILVWDIAVADLRAGSGGAATVVFAVIVSAAFTALPVAVGLRWAISGRAGAALLVALASLLMSGGGFVILTTAFTP